jgi:hypothetical protein
VIAHFKKKIVRVANGSTIRVGTPRCTGEIPTRFALLSDAADGRSLVEKTGESPVAEVGIVSKLTCQLGRRDDEGSLKSDGLMAEDRR